MNSIRTRLFVILLLTTGAIWLSAAAWIYTSTQRQVEKVLDARLTEAARMVSSLLTDHQIDAAAAVKAVPQKNDQPFTVSTASYARQLSCQIWSLQGQLVSRSESAPDTSLANHREGFAETTINGVRWRVYAVVNQQLGVRVLVGDSMAMRVHLVSDVAKGLLLPAVLILPLLAVMIWLSVGRGLSPLERLATALSNRSSAELHPLTESSASKEITPMVRALNGLFERVAASRQRERNFVAYAAHELKTPLAGLKTQAQIAIRAKDDPTREKALRHILGSVDRTSRMVRQLIDLAAVDTSEMPDDGEDMAVGRLLAEVATELGPMAADKQVTLDCQPADPSIVVRANQTLLRVAVRNVVENAIQHTPPNSTVSCVARCRNGMLEIAISDRGPGIPSELHDKVTDRFYRGNHAMSGSGLGLAIVKMAIQRLAGKLTFLNDHGLTVTLSCPSGLSATSYGASFNAPPIGQVA